MSSDSDDSRYKKWWRWPLVPIASVAVVVVWFWSTRWSIGTMEGGLSEYSWWFYFSLLLVISAIAGWFYAWVACQVAPRGKVIAGSVVTTLLIIVELVTIKAVWKFPEFTSAEALSSTGQAIAMSVAAIAAITFVRGGIRRASANRQ